MNTRRRVAAAVGIVGIVAISITGCFDKATEPFRDSPISRHDDKPALVINEPDGFNNVAFKCNGKTGVYVIYHGNSKYGAVSAVANDPQCA